MACGGCGISSAAAVLPSPVTAAAPTVLVPPVQQLAGATSPREAGCRLTFCWLLQVLAAALVIRVLLDD